MSVSSFFSDGHCAARPLFRPTPVRAQSITSNGMAGALDQAAVTMVLVKADPAGAQEAAVAPDRDQAMAELVSASCP